MRLENRVVFITGASRGIGRACALACAAEGASVVIAARTDVDTPRLPGTIHEVARAVEALGGKALAVKLDVRDDDACEAAIAATLERFGRIDALVNNAGTSSVRSLEQLTDADWQEQWDLNVMAPMRLMRDAAPAMARGGWGRIVNVSSSSGKRPGKRNMAYSVTKAAELSLSRSFADLYASAGVLVNAVAPGPVGTDLWLAPGGLADQTADAQGISRERAIATTAGGVPLGRLGGDQEIASVIVFLCSEAASYVTGAAWSVDGGIVQTIV
jgi:3-oxoacyl-[acyl-carrier protein] reductase